MLHDSLSVLLGGGDGSFGDPLDYGTGFGSKTLELVDLTGDGVLEAVVANQQLAADKIEMKKDMAANAHEFGELQKDFSAARDEVEQLEGLFARHDFNYLFQKKPGLILKRANAATERVWDNYTMEINTSQAGSMPTSNTTGQLQEAIH